MLTLCYILFGLLYCSLSPGIFTPYGNQATSSLILTSYNTIYPPSQYQIKIEEYLRILLYICVLLVAISLYSLKHTLEQEQQRNRHGQ